MKKHTLVVAVLAVASVAIGGIFDGMEPNERPKSPAAAGAIRAYEKA